MNRTYIMIKPDAPKNSEDHGWNPLMDDMPGHSFEAIHDTSDDTYGVSRDGYIWWFAAAQVDVLKEEGRTDVALRTEASS